MPFNPVLSTGIIAIYLVFTLGVGILAWRISPSSDTEDYLLANRGVHWFVGFFSMAASQFSALTFMGFMAFYYNFGVGAFLAIAGSYIYLTLGFYYFVGPKIWKLGRRYGHITPSDLVSDFYDSPVLGYIVGVGLILALIPYLNVQFMGIGIVLELGTGGLVSYIQGAAVIAVVIAIYTWLGGMKSVAWVDTLQGVLLVGGSIVGGIGIFFAALDGFGPAYDAVAADAPSLLTVSGSPVFDWGYIFTFSVIVFIGFIFHPHMWIRFHYFKNGRQVENLPWVLSVIHHPTQIVQWIIVLAGVYLAVEVPPDQFLLTMFRDFFPTALFAIIAAAALAAMMSSASSQCHGIGAIVSRDITKKVFDEWGESRHLFVARVVTLFSLAAAFGLSTLGIEFLLDSGAASASLAIALVLPQVIGALYGWEWATKEGAIAGSIVGVVVGLLFLATPWITVPGGLWEGLWGVVANVVVFVAVSLVTDSQPQREKNAEWQETLQLSYAELESMFRRDRRDEREQLLSDD